MRRWQSLSDDLAAVSSAVSYLRTWATNKEPVATSVLAVATDSVNCTPAGTGSCAGVVAGCWAKSTTSGGDGGTSAIPIVLRAQGILLRGGKSRKRHPNDNFLKGAWR